MRYNFSLIVIFLFYFFYFNNKLFPEKYWNKVGTYFSDKKVLEFPAFTAVDIDGDNDLDVFIGTWDGYLSFYRNISDKNDKELKFRLENSGVTIKDSFNNIHTSYGAVPFFVDIDGDNDYDLFLGNLEGTITFYKNIGTPIEPKFKLINEGSSKENSYFHIDVGYNSVPFFVDIDGDNDYDLFIGERDGFINFYRNVGDFKIAVFKPINFAEDINTSFNNIDVGECSYPSFIDIDGDNDYDLFIGNWEGYLFFYRNDGTKFAPFFNEINYAISKEFSFNKFQSEGDSRVFITDFFKDKKVEFIFSTVDGKINIYRVNRDILKLVKKEEKIDINTKMANYYYEIAKELYVDGKLIESRLTLNKGLKYKNSVKLIELKKILTPEIKELIAKISLNFKRNFERDNFVEAITYLLKSEFNKSLTLFYQLNKLTKGAYDNILNKYIQIADKYEKERKISLKVERMDEDARELYKNGKYKEALEIWKKASNLRPEDYSIVENIIMCENKLDEIETGGVIQRLLKRARKYINNNKKNKAIEIYAKIVELGGNNLDENIKKEINRLKLDIMEYKEREKMKELEELYKKGVFAEKRKDYETAMDNFRKIIFYNSCYKDVCDRYEKVKKLFYEKEKAK